MFSVKTRSAVVLVHVFGGPMEKYFNLAVRTGPVYLASTKQPDDIMATLSIGKIARTELRVIFIITLIK